MNYCAQYIIQTGSGLNTSYLRSHYFEAKEENL